MTALLVPGLFLLVFAAALHRRMDLYSALTDGASEGLRLMLRLLPPLIVLLPAAAMLRASGSAALSGNSLPRTGRSRRESAPDRPARSMAHCRAHHRLTGPAREIPSRTASDAPVSRAAPTSAPRPSTAPPRTEAANKRTITHDRTNSSHPSCKSAGTYDPHAA